MKKHVWFVIKIVFFFICIGLIVFGHQTVGRVPLLIMLLGLGGLLLLLHSYNRKYT